MFQFLMLSIFYYCEFTNRWHLSVFNFFWLPENHIKKFSPKLHINEIGPKDEPFGTIWDFFPLAKLWVYKSPIEICYVVIMFLYSSKMQQLRPVIRPNNKFSRTKLITSVHRLLLESNKEYLEEGTQVSSFFWLHFRSALNAVVFWGLFLLFFFCISRPRRQLSILRGIRIGAKKLNYFEVEYNKKHYGNPLLCFLLKVIY